VSDTYSGVPQQSAETIESTGGSAMPPETPVPGAGGGGRRGWFIFGGLATAVVVGAGAYAAAQFFATGAQPAEVLPATTIGYASIDLDPSGTQKIEALRTLNKFPAFKEEYGLDADDDIRRKIFEELDLPEGCHLSYDADIEPWLGERMAVAAVDAGAKEPEVVAVIQVKDRDAADEALTTLRDCGDGEASGGWVFDGDWVIVAEELEDAQAVADANDEGTLADDEDFKTLTSAAGDAGIVALYAAPEAGKYFGQEAGDVTGMADELTEGLTGGGIDLGDALDSPDSQAPTGGGFEDFKGMAVTVRFDDGALEIEGAGDSGIDLSKVLGTDRGGDVVETLPPATAAAIGVGFEEGWLTQVVEQMASFSGGETTAADLFAEASEATGLDLPQDAEALVGRSAALMFGSDFDPEAFFNSGDPSDLPIALKAQGDDKAAIAVLEKILAQQPDASKYLGLDSDAGYFVIGPDTELRTAILGNGGLGDTEIYRDVIRESDKASAVVFVNFNAGDDWLVNLVGEDPTVAENVKPLAGFGIATWQDDDWTHGVLRLTTD
jgi:hypothetical protein